MAYDRYSGASDDDTAKVRYCLELLAQKITERSQFESMWEESAAVCLPEYRNTMSFGNVRSPGLKWTQYQLDTAGSIACQRFMAIASGLLTPSEMLWSVYRANDKNLMKQRRVREYFEAITTAVWEERYRFEANFVAWNNMNMMCLGAFGNMGMFTEELETGPSNCPPGISYRSAGPGEVYLLTNHQGRVDGFIKHFKWNARQAYQRWPETIGKQVRIALEKNSQELFDFLLFCWPRTDYNPQAIFTPQSKPWCGIYVDYTGQCILEESGFRSLPLQYGRYEQYPGEDHGRGPAQRVLPALKTLNAASGIFMTTAHRGADPVILLPGDDSLDWKNYPGAHNYGTVNEDGKPLALTMPTGSLEYPEKLMAREEKAVSAAFLLDLFPILRRNVEAAAQRMRNAREVVEDLVDRTMFLAPTLGRQFGDYLGPMSEREINILAYQRRFRRKGFPEMPPELKEAQGQYKTVFCSTLALSMRLQRTAGLMRTVDIANAVAQATGSNEIMDIFEFDMALPDVAEDQYVPVGWTATPQRLAQKRQGRAKAAQEDRRVKSLPGEAAMAKAEAIQTKAATGGNIGGTLSGMPEGGMPMMPGQNAPGGRAF